MKSVSKMSAPHPYIPEARQLLLDKRISRREFLRLATLLGCSVASAAAMSTGIPVRVAGAAALDRTQTSGIQRGGTLRVASQVPPVDHPARFSWISDANQFRHVFEYLTETDRHNITRPYLLQSWQVSSDLTQWTLKLRAGVSWTNGELLTADHVKWNFEQWLDRDIGSSMLGLWEGYLTPTGVEVVDPLTLRLHLDAPLLAVPEYLFHYPAQITHPSFDGDIASGKNLSTGPYLLDEYVVGERVRVVSRVANGDDRYWQNGVDRRPLPYLDAIEWFDLGQDLRAHVAALRRGEVDTFYSPDLESFMALRDDPSLNIIRCHTSQTQVLRMRVDMDPWKDNRVRLALKRCQNRQKILDQAYFGEGLLGHDTHVSPVHPEYLPMEVPQYDPAGAKALLAEAGYPDGLDATISVGSGWPYVIDYAETLREDARPAGIRLTLDRMPNSAYWDIWDQTPLGITPWTHRPLAMMLLPLAYIADSRGEPVPWNETRWVDQEFSALLRRAQGTLNIEERRALTGQLQRIQSERGSIGIAFWRDNWAIFNRAFHNVPGHPTAYNLWREAWFGPDLGPFDCISPIQC